MEHFRSTLLFLLSLFSQVSLPGQEISFHPRTSGGPSIEIRGRDSVLLLGGEAGPLVFLDSRGKEGVSQGILQEGLSWEKRGETFLLAGRLEGGKEFRLTLCRTGRELVRLRLEIPGKAPSRKAGIALALKPGEALFGLLERTIPGNQALSWKPGVSRGLDLRGLEVPMVVRPTLGIYEPFLVSSRGWSLLVSGTWPGRFDLGASRKERLTLSFGGPDLEVLFHLPGSVRECVKALTLREGPPFLPPDWALGPWRWRDEHRNPEKFFDGTPNELPFNTWVVEDVLMMEALGIPCTAYWVDRPWARGFAGYGSLQFDRKRLPQPERMIAWLRRKGMAFLLWLAPWVAGDPLRSARERNYLLPGCSAKKGKIALLDFTNPAAVGWWHDRLRPLLEAGVTGFKLDRSEEIFRDSMKLRSADGRPLTELRNDYPRLYLKAVHDLLERVIPGRGLAMPRAGYTGSQKYGIFWGGDIRGGPWGLRAALVAVQRAAFMGFPFWGSDTGGYWGPFDRETVRRWLAFSCFCPVMEVGPTWDRAPWDWPKEPSYDVKTLAAWRFYAVLRMRMIGYLRTTFLEALVTGLPPVRPLAMLWPRRKEALQRFEEYLFGPDLLVAIPWRKGTRSMQVWIPPGTWRDAWRGREFRGPLSVEVPCPDPRVPLFLRKGSPFSPGDLEELWAESLRAVKEPPSMEVLQRKALEELRKGESR